MCVVILFGMIFCFAIERLQTVYMKFHYIQYISNPDDSSHSISNRIFLLPLNNRSKQQKKGALISAAASKSFDYFLLKCREHYSELSVTCFIQFNWISSECFIWDVILRTDIHCLTLHALAFLCVHIQFNYDICAFRLFFPYACDKYFHKYVEFIVIVVEIYALVFFSLSLSLLSHRQIKFEYIFTCHGFCLGLGLFTTFDPLRVRQRSETIFEWMNKVHWRLGRAHT